MEYELNNGEAENLPQERTVLDEEVALPLASKEGYTFEGWYDNAEFSGEKVEVLNADNIMTSKLYAKFTPIAYELSY